MIEHAIHTVYRIVPVEGGRLAIRREDGTAVLGDRDFPSESVAVGALRELLGARGKLMQTFYRDDGKVDRVEVGGLG